MEARDDDGRTSMTGDTEAGVRAAFAQQATWCRELGSPLTGLLMEVVGRNLDRSTRIGARILDWPGRADAGHDALTLRLAGGLHALVRRGRLPDLAGLYPPNPMPDGPALWRAVAAALADAGDALAPWLDGAPQTNEVARSAVLMPGLMQVAQETGLPVALYELGASAGLNLLPDRYAYQLGPVAAGAAGSPVRLRPDWQGPPPSSAPVQVVRRRGVDLNPLDVTRPADQERLLAYIWADQAERLARTQAAIALAAADPPPLDRGDAADWTEGMLHPAPEPGVARVLMHSIAAQYFPERTRARIAAHAARVGAQATRAAPFAWLRFEGDARYGPRPALLLTLWPGGRERLLATGSAHGLWVRWAASEER